MCLMVCNAQRVQLHRDIGRWFVSTSEFNGLGHQCRGLSAMWFIKLSTVSVHKIQ